MNASNSRSQPKRIGRAIAALVGSVFAAAILVQGVNAVFDLGLESDTSSTGSDPPNWPALILLAVITCSLLLLLYTVPKKVSKNISRKQDRRRTAEFGEFENLNIRQTLIKVDGFDAPTIDRLQQWERSKQNRASLLLELEKLKSRALIPTHPRGSSPTETKTARFSSSTDNTSTKKMRKSFVLALWAIGVLAVLAVIPVAGMIYRVSTGCGAFETQDTCNAKRAEVNAAKRAVMPSLQGQILRDARSDIKDLAMGLKVEEQDLIYSRGVWDADNWTVMTQSPQPGSELRYGASVCIGIAKNDETWQTQNRLQCWQKIDDDFLDASDAVAFLSNDLVKLSNLPQSLKGTHLRATIQIEMDRGNTVQLPYCTYGPVSGREANLKIDASNGGDPGAFAKGGQSFEASLFLEWSGSYRYSVKKLEKSSAGGCFTF